MIFCVVENQTWSSIPGCFCKSRPHFHKLWLDFHTHESQICPKENRTWSSISGGFCKNSTSSIVNYGENFIPIKFRRQGC
ncbi:hypothetical protein RchiOBHm_Chr1g0345601 [Rosa chinensis]|uniref:Uncharacterized protein n=1 Tax=Rosa chinensis TaxID=74649 RepID=A0A2P6SEU1_ROSCH|nr:hypothetical protein RchiOBHm_Chr1g0345601 [Rosa chinensis]